MTTVMQQFILSESFFVGLYISGKFKQNPLLILAMSSGSIQTLIQSFRLNDLLIITDIMLTCPCSLHPLKFHFYRGKLGFTGVNIFFLIFVSKGLTCNHNLCFEEK